MSLTRLMHDLNYFTFTRKNNDGNGSYDIEVPAEFCKYVPNPQDFTAFVEGLYICDFVEGKLVDHKQKTLEARKRFVNASPRMILHYNNRDLYQKRVDLSKLIYDRFLEHEGCLDVFEEDYILEKKAATLYCSMAGICSQEQFDLSEKKKRIVPLVNSQLARNARCGKIYLLSDVHKLS